MTLQPLLIIRDMGIDHIGNRHRQRRDEPAIDEKGDEAPRPSHISTGELFAPSAAAAAAHVLCEPLHDLAVDVDQGDVGLSQPCGEMASRIPAPRLRVPRSPQRSAASPHPTKVGAAAVRYRSPPAPLVPSPTSAIVSISGLVDTIIVSTLAPTIR